MASVLDVSNTKLVVSKGTCFDIWNNEKHILVDIPEIKDELDEIIDVSISSDDKLLAIITSVSKKLLVYDLNDISNVKLFTLPRAASKSRFTQNNDHLLVADKTGDVLLFDINKENDEGVKVFGLLSLLLDVLTTEDEKYIITCDRDEKIRVTCYPNTYDIQTYCLGHREFVKHIQLLPHNKSYLTSTSGDGTIKIWNYITGNMCYSMDANNENDALTELMNYKNKYGVEISSLPITHYSICKVSDNQSLAAVVISSLKKVVILTISGDNSSFKHSIAHVITLNYFPSGLKFHMRNLYIFNAVCNEIEIYSFVDMNFKTFSLIKSIKVFEGREVQSNDNDPLLVLYKRKFDDLHDYTTRKQKRIENKTSRNV